MSAMIQVFREPRSKLPQKLNPRPGPPSSATCGDSQGRVVLKCYGHFWDPIVGYVGIRVGTSNDPSV